MASKIKKISVVVYCNGNFEETKSTLYSIIDQNMSHMFFDVFILNDCANAKFTNSLNDFIKSQELVNYKVFSFSSYSGLPISFNFLLKNNIITTAYTTIVKSGDTLDDDFLNRFLEKLYPMKEDVYMFDLRDELITPQDSIDSKTGKNYTVSKSKMIIAAAPEGELSQDEAICTKPIFLGKIWKTSLIYNINTDPDKILYQDIYMYLQMIIRCQKIWYESYYAGTIRRKSWLPKEMDVKRIELLSLTLNKMVSRNPYINGHILQLLALALQRTPKALRTRYFIANFKYLQNNVIIPIYNISKRKVTKLTKPFIQKGEILVEE